MVDIPKHLTNGMGGNLFSDIKNIFSLLRTRKTMVFAYGFMFSFVCFTAFLAFNPSSTSSSLWFKDIFSSSSTATGFRSQVSSMYSYFYPNSSLPMSQNIPNAIRSDTVGHETPSEEPNLNQTVLVPSTPSASAPSSPVAENETEVNMLPPPPSSSPENETAVNMMPLPPSSSPVAENETEVNMMPPPPLSSPVAENETEVNKMPPPPSSSPVAENETEVDMIPPPPSSSPENETEVNMGPEQNRVSNFTDSSSEETNQTPPRRDKIEKISKSFFKSLMNCNIFDGGWVVDDSYPLYPPGSCPHIDEPFNCFVNGRTDSDFQKYRWKPKECDIPRLDGEDMLELLRGKRLVYVGDSLNRNMWESMVCLLRNSVNDKSKVFEASGRREFRTEGYYSFVFQDYNCSVEFFRSPFLVQEWEMPDLNGTTKETLRLDLVERSSSKYADADILVFNTGHWWTHEKTSKGRGYYQVGNHVYGTLNVDDAFHKALSTWAKWVDVNVNPNHTLVSFRGYSTSHFRGGQWNSGGSCDNETEPIKNEKYLSAYEPKMKILETVMHEMKTPVSYLNITRMTDYRKDAHPSVYRKQNLSEEERKSPLRFQDCSHWCLPGVPEIWNELLYAEILIYENRKRHELKKQMQQQQQQQQQQALQQLLKP